MSFNYHKDHFSKTWGLVGEDGATAHTGCVAFGMDRLAIALFAIHGLESVGLAARGSRSVGAGGRLIALASRSATTRERANEHGEHDRI